MLEVMVDVVMESVRGLMAEILYAELWMTGIEREVSELEEGI